MKVLEIKEALALGGAHGFSLNVNGTPFPFTKSELFKTSFRKNEKIKAAYLILFEQSGEGYAGSTSNIRKRLSQHRSGMLTGTHENKRVNTSFKSANKYEISVIIVMTETREKAFEIEQLFIDFLKSTGVCLNIALDSRNNLSGLSEEERQKAIAATTKYWSGRHHSDETKAKISSIHKGRVFSEETIEKMRLASLDEKIKTFRLSNLKDHVENCRKRISINGAVFGSIEEAATLLDIGRSTISYRLNSDSNQFSSYFYLE